MIGMPGLACALLVASGAQAAVMVDSAGRGQVLIFPYYTVNAGEQTLLSIVNPTNTGKAVKLRFRESRNGREVFGLNLYLGEFDVWTAGVFADSEGSPARLLTRDSSCTLPRIHGNTALPQLPDGTRYTSFSTDSFAGGRSDGGAQDASRTREGYFEAIEMGTLVNNSESDFAATPIAGVPRDCAALAAAWLPGGYWSADPSTDLLPPSGQLFGSASIVNTTLGTAYDARPTALSGFSVVVQHGSPVSALPDLSSAITETDRVKVESAQVIDGKVYRSQWPQERAVDAVSAVLMRSDLRNQFDVNPVIGARSDWIVTFPTKRHYVDPVLNNGTALAPFTNSFNALFPACERVNLSLYDREERRPVGIIDYYPPYYFDCICNSTAQLRFNRGYEPLPYPNAGCRFGNISTTFGENSTFQNGHLNMGLASNGHQMRPSLDEQRFQGLPVIGFWRLRYQDSASGSDQIRFFSEAKPHSGKLTCDAGMLPSSCEPSVGGQR